MTSANKPSEMLAGGVLRDWQRVNRDRRGLWLATALALVGLLAFVAFFNIIAPPLNERLQDWPLIAIGLLMSLAPALLWLLFFYQMDRLEPEPKRKVINIFIIAALLTAGLAYPLLHKIFVIESWLYHTWWTQMLGSILIVGVTHMLVVYLAVRYGIYFDPEFDERVDGVIYATAAGLGVATVLNFAFIFRHGGVDLDVGSIRMVINALAYASCAGILGYALGQTRFEKNPFYYLPFAFLLAAALNGLFFFLEDRVSMQGLQAQDSNGLILATVFALITLLIIFWLIRRANEETLRLSRHTPAPAAKTRSRAPVPTKPPAPAVRPTPQPAASAPPASPRPRATTKTTAPRPSERPASPPPKPSPPPATSRPPAPPSPRQAAPAGDEEDESTGTGIPNKEEILSDVKSSWQALLEDLQQVNDSPEESQ